MLLQDQNIDPLLAGWMAGPDLLLYGKDTPPIGAANCVPLLATCLGQFSQSVRQGNLFLLSCAAKRICGFVATHAQQETNTHLKGGGSYSLLLGFSH